MVVFLLAGSSSFGHSDFLILCIEISRIISISNEASKNKAVRNLQEILTVRTFTLGKEPSVRSPVESPDALIYSYGDKEVYMKHKLQALSISNTTILSVHVILPVFVCIVL